MEKKLLRYCKKIAGKHDMPKEISNKMSPYVNVCQCDIPSFSWDISDNVASNTEYQCPEYEYNDILI